MTMMQRDACEMGKEAPLGKRLVGRSLLSWSAGLSLALATMVDIVQPRTVKAAAISQPPAAAERPLFNVAANPMNGTIIATLPRPDASGLSGRYIYLTQIETGVGSAVIGLDRTETSESQILVFRRFGNKVIAELENTRFVPRIDDPNEQRVAHDSFATSTVWVGTVLETNGDGSFAVDLASFVARDAAGIAGKIKRNGGEVRLVRELSFADAGFVKTFPRNVELAASLSFRIDQPNAELANIIPGVDTITIRLRHSLIALPESGYVPRHDPFGYAIARQRIDYSAPLGEPVVQNLARRFRLERVDPNATHSPVKKPIVFYIDNGAPEPERTALREGVQWWGEAFAAAGFDDAFRVEVLPPNADPLDVRYNVVNWVNRATRGWSFGGGVDDPRTGEIIKGAVVLGSLRARQDMMIFQALVGAGLTGTGDPNDPITATLARIRLLGAHEVGHALGLMHNFAASTQGHYSVMDYPAPRVTLVDGVPSLIDAYGTGVGQWDKFAIAWLYGARTDADAAPVLASARARGLRFVANEDARAPGTGHPNGAIWDDGADSVGELKRVMAVRRVALARFGPGAVGRGQSLAELRRSFVPIWLLHRYQLEAAAKSLGGVDFPYALAGEGLTSHVVEGKRQQAALAVLLQALTPEELAVPARLTPLLSGGFGGERDRQTDIEIIPTANGSLFDPLEATEIAALQTLNSLLSADRLNRLEAQHGVDSSIPSPGKVADQLLDSVLASVGDEVGRRIATTAILALARTQRDPSLSPVVALEYSSILARLAVRLGKPTAVPPSAIDWADGLARLLNDSSALEKAITDAARTTVIPPGMPIGAD